MQKERLTQAPPITRKSNRDRKSKKVSVNVYAPLKKPKE